MVQISSSTKRRYIKMLSAIKENNFTDVSTEHTARNLVSFAWTEEGLPLTYGQLRGQTKFRVYVR